MEISKNISYKLKNANVFFTVLIVWLHVSSNYTLPEWVGNVAIFSVPCFFAISSFLYFKSFDFADSWAAYRKKVVGRFKSLIIPFLIFNFIGFVLGVLFHVLHPVGANPIDVFLQSPVSYILTSKANGPLWYLLALFCFFLFAPLLGYLIRMGKWTIIFLCPLYLVCHDVSYYLFPYWMTCIFTGAYIAIYFDYLQGLHIHPVIQTGGGILVLVILVIGTLGMIDAYTTRLLAPFCFIIIYKLINLVPKFLVSFIAPFSLLIYCLHLPVSRIAIRVPMLLHLTSMPIVSLCISTGVTILLIVMAGHALKKSPKLWAVMTGGR